MLPGFDYHKAITRERLQSGLSSGMNAPIYPGKLYATLLKYGKNCGEYLPENRNGQNANTRMV